MPKLAFIALTGLTTILPAFSRPLPQPIVIHGPRPTTSVLREEMLGETVRYSLQRQSFKVNLSSAVARSHFNPVYDPWLRLSTYYDNHLLDELNRIDNPYGHNRPGFGINF